MRRLHVVRGLGPAGALWLASPHPLRAQGTALVPAAEAYVAAWNAHDLGAVLACFAPDAIVRERRGEVPPAVWDTRDPRVARAYLADSFYGEAYDTHGFAWATGRPQIAAWAAARFAQRHRFATDRHHAAGDAVGWRYREFVDPFQGAPGFSPAEGSAEAVVRDGRITSLTLVQSPESVERRRGEEAAALAVFARAAATGRAAANEDGRRGQPSGLPHGGPAAEATTPAWPLALGGLAVLGAVAAGLRRRRAPQR